MPILSGKRLGPYELLSSIGAGGMGEVYRAQDTRLNRIVAIKVLPPHLADSSEMKERFEREARTIASLNHPHICTLYDVGHQDGTDFLVMEYLEGETLAQRLVKGPLPLEQVLRYAIEIADALDKAHRKGVTHRDLKPGNIMLTKSGTKLLDFGLAKLRQEVAPAASPLSQLPTATHAITAQGTILGTLQYMAPEQVEGKDVDARSDIFAFGAVVYEMATGKKAFEGKSQASVISAIMSSDPPPISALQPMIPPALDRVVKRCLAKEPDDRWQTARDLHQELKWIAEGGSQAGVTAAATVDGTRLTRRSILFSAVAILIAAVIVGLAIWNLKPSPSPRPVRALRSRCRRANNWQVWTMALLWPSLLTGLISRMSPARVECNRFICGRWIVWKPHPIPGTDGAGNPFFSPDGRWVGFFADGKLKKIAVSGGAAMTLSDSDISFPRGASWGSQEMIAIAGRVALQQVSGRGRRPAAADSSWKRGGRPPMARVLARRKGSAFRCGIG